MTPIPPRTPAPVLEGVGGAALPAPGAGAAGGAAAGIGPSALEVLFARGRGRAMLSMLGPSFVAAIAYVDPGNFATNIQGGARFGYLLLWVVLVANLMAMLIQYLSAKLGIATDASLPGSSAGATRARRRGRCGYRRRSWRWPPMWRSS